MTIDPAFEEYFSGRLHQVFLYVTDVCGLRCEQCLYKTTLADRELDEPVALRMLEVFRRYGAKKLTFIGGEPTLYGARQNSEPLFHLIDRARDLEYEYIRLDTNGQFRRSLLQAASMKRLDNLAFSLDGHEPEVHDGLRGRDTFRRCVERIKQAVAEDLYVSVTACVHPGNVDRIDAMIAFVSDLGVREFNMHPLFQMGIERDAFSGNTHIEPKRWMEVYADVRSKIDRGVYAIPVRLPLRFVASSEYARHPEAYEYCPVRMGERVLVHPNGEIRICALCIGSPYHIARYDQSGIFFGASQSELAQERIARRPCMSQVKDFGDLTPLCISYKPHQNEYVWRTQGFDGQFVTIAPIKEAC